MVEPRDWCDTCQNTGFVTCYCGGDLCICENNGEMECPACWGTSEDDECYCDFASREFFECFDRSHAAPCPQAEEGDPEYGGPQDWPGQENVP